ncbi:MAG: sigma-70 family RNA polymerase sigma factor [Chloroflexi bacterium]|nr:sigma-70 family RNA polymerase sigma factor [Chloroflexota bacterium]
MTDNGTSDRELVARIQAGDKAACAACIEKHSPGVYRLALRLMQHEADAEDVVQETFLSAFKAIDDFQGRSQLSTWLYRITYNTAMMRLRKHQPETVSVEETETADDGSPVPTQLFDWCCLPESDFDTNETRARLEQAIRALPDKLRVVFVLRELEGLSTEETAHALDISNETVKTRLHRARLWLRERLSAHFTELAYSREGR